MQFIKLIYVEPRNSVLQNSGKPRISAKFLNDQIFTFKLLNLQNSGNPAIAEEFRMTKLSAIAGFYCTVFEIGKI